MEKVFSDSILIEIMMTMLGIKSNESDKLLLGLEYRN